MKINWKTLWITEVVAIFLLLVGCQLILLQLDKANMVNTTVVTTAGIIMWCIFWVLLLTISIVRRCPVVLTLLGGFFTIIGIYWQTMMRISGFELMLPLYRLSIFIQYILLLLGIIMVIVGIIKERHQTTNYYISKLDLGMRIAFLAVYVWAFIQDVHLTRHLFFYADSGMPIPFTNSFFLMNIIANVLILVLSITGLFNLHQLASDDLSKAGGWLATISVILLILISYGAPMVLMVFPVPAFFISLNLIGILMMLPGISLSNLKK